MPARASGRTSASMKARTACSSARPSMSRTAAIGQRLVARGEQLVEHRLRVAHAARGQVRHEGDRGRLGRAALIGQDAVELARDLVHRQRPEREALQARQDGRPDLARVGRAEDEDDVVGRILQRPEEDVPAFLDALDLVDDEDLAAQVRGRGVDARQQLAHVVDLVVGGRVELDHVERPALADRRAGLAAVARLAIDRVGAVDRLGQDAGHGRLAGAARSDEQEAVGQPVEADGVAQRLHDRGLAHHLAEGLGPPAAVDGLVGSRAGHPWMIRPGVPTPGGRVAVHPPSTETFACPHGRSARIRPVRGTRRAALIAASFRT